MAETASGMGGDGETEPRADMVKEERGRDGKAGDEGWEGIKMDREKKKKKKRRD
jgi:hypothetical protein